MDTASKIKLAERVLAAHGAQLATTANPDQVRRSIRATEQRLAELRRAAR